MLKTLHVCVLAWAGASSGLAQAQTSADGQQLSRYTSFEATPAASVSNPLAVIATVSFPRGHVQTVGDAMRHLLVRTGYRLVADDQLDETSRVLLQLPLPESHRQLGPYRVDAMLQALLGDAWRLQTDPLLRSVRFVPTVPSATAAPQTAAASRS